MLLGVLLRVAFAFGYWTGKPLMQDEQEYLLLATEVASGHGFGYPVTSGSEQARHFERPPFFPFYLAAVLKAGDWLSARTILTDTAFPQSSSDVPRSIKAAQCLAGASAIFVIAVLAWRAGGSRAAIAAAGIAAVYPPLVWSCAYVLTEPLYSLLALTTVWLLQKSTDLARNAERSAGFGAGLLGGLGLLTKEGMIFFLPLATVWLVYRRRVDVALALLVGAAAVTTPWIVRNYEVHDRFVLTAAHGGVTLWTGNNPVAHGEGDLAANPDMARVRMAFEDAHPGADNQELDSLYYREVFRFVTGQPLQWIWLCVKKVFYTFVPIGPSYRLHSTLYYAASLVSYVPLVLIALFGIRRLRSRGRPAELWALGLLAVSAVAVCLVFFPQERFRVPVLDPAAIIAASMCWIGPRQD